MTPSFALMRLRQSGVRVHPYFFYRLSLPFRTDSRRFR